MNFQEKSAWACLLAILVIYVPYFWATWSHPMAALGLFIVAAIAMIILLTVFHGVNAIATKSIRQSGDVPPIDELDEKIELRAAKRSGFVLAVAVIVWVIHHAYSLPFVVSEGPQGAMLPVTDAMQAIQWIFAGFVIANVVYYASIVISYRRLVSG